jgi:glycosyltransferase involved in cell wall biosynthesis
LKNSEGLKITIITVCKNSVDFLEETITSVIKQTYQNIQYIVIDGNSTDATVNIINQLQEHARSGTAQQFFEEG